jgi:4-diphosphocytidyl-2-C-methyl-D-erythritol kinase
MVRIVTELAPAKINLYLRVTGRRPDGYHELDSLMLPLSLHDVLELELRDRRSTAVRLRCNSPNLPADGRNLAVRAALAFMSEFKIEAEVMIDLHKIIPAGAGLGGGSSDAAAVLRAMSLLTRISEPERLASLALRLGADVPFFLAGGPARARGIGERLTPLTNFPRLDLALAVPRVEVLTAGIFGALRSHQWSGEMEGEVIAALESLKDGAQPLINDLETVAAAQFPVITELKAALYDLGASACAMSGSGGAVFGIFPGAEQASAASKRLGAAMPGITVFAVHSLS